MARPTSSACAASPPTRAARGPAARAGRASSPARPPARARTSWPPWRAPTAWPWSPTATASPRAPRSTSSSCPDPLPPAFWVLKRRENATFRHPEREGRVLGAEAVRKRDVPAPRTGSGGGAYPGAMAAPPAPARPLVDGFGRVHRDLRISITDRCNFRCTYCLPEEGIGWLPRAELLTYEEIERVARLFVERYGFESVRLTGGEPTVRAHLPVLVAKLAALGVDLSLTTNGASLALLADELAAAGLRRINVSLDS